MIHIFHRGTNSSVYELDASCFTKQNFVAGVTENDTLSIKTPIGVLAGSVAAVSGDFKVVPANGTNKAVGIFFKDAAEPYLQNDSAGASGKISVVTSQPIYEVDVFETHNAGAAITYVVGESLYASANGLLTNVPSVEGTVLGICIKVPTTESMTLGVQGTI